MFRLAAPTLRSNARAFTTGKSRISTCHSSHRPVSAFKAAPLVRAAAPTLTKYVEGTVNDPIPFPAPNKSHGSYHWTFERALSAALVPLIAGTAVSSVNPIYDGILSVAIVAHSHMGFDQLLTDYLHPRKFPTIGPIMIWLLRAATGGVLVGIYQFNTNDIGLTELVKKVWTA